MDGDPVFQWILGDDDRLALPPVDEDFYGLKDFSSLCVPTDPRIDPKYNESNGLLLADTFDANTLPHRTPPGAGQNTNMFLPTPDPSQSHIASSYESLFPPALSPDSSPTSAGSSTPWLRTPQTDPSVANVDALWPFPERGEQSCSTIHFLDESGNSLEDIPPQDMMLEDIVCTPDITSLALVCDPTPCGSRSETPVPSRGTSTLVVSPPRASARPNDVVSPPPPHCALLPPSSLHSARSLFVFSPTASPSGARKTPLPGYLTSLSLSPLSTISVFSQSPSAPPSPLSHVGCSALSPAILSAPFPNGEERVETVDSVSSTHVAGVALAKSRGKRSAETLDDEAPPWKIPRQSKTKNVDDEEWNPGSARVRRPRAAASPKYAWRTSTSNPDCPVDKGSRCGTSHQGSEGHSEATQTNCHICGQGFTRVSDYARHMENSASHPETRKVWPCPYCQSTLGRRDALGRHVKTMHPGRPIVVSEGIPGSELPEGQNEPSVQRIRQGRTSSSRRQPVRKSNRKYH